MDHPTHPLWTPSASRIAASHLSAFTRLAEAAWNRRFADYAELWQTSVDHPAHFWSLAWDYCGVIGDKGESSLINADSMQSARFFPQARLNYTENLLRRNDQALALQFWGEDLVQAQLSWRELYDRVSQLRQALQAHGIACGDRVAGWLPNLADTIVAMLATTSLGAIWTDCPPELGVKTVVDCFGQTTPKLLFCSQYRLHNGQFVSREAELEIIRKQLPSIEQIVLLPYPDQAASTLPAGCLSLQQFTAPFQPGPISYPRFSFDHPLLILYSCGSSNKPRCIVHGTGGTLLQQLKEHQLHGDIHLHDRLLSLGTHSGMMRCWQTGALASGASLLLYDGAPFADNGQMLWQCAASGHATHLALPAMTLDQARKLGQTPQKDVKLNTLRTLFAFGSPLMPESYDWVYQAIKSDLNLASMLSDSASMSCFALGNPNLPVERGALQCRALGMAVEVFDPHGVRLYQEKGELVCCRPFPSMPVALWNDSDDNGLRRAFFNHYPNVWSHGDIAEITPEQGLIMHGRTETALKPGGVRIGTAEIYRQLESFEEIEQALVVGQQWNNDERIILFVRMIPGMPLNPTLVAAIQQHIRQNCSSHHVPAQIIAVSELPMTPSGQIAERAVKNILDGHAALDPGILANPEALHLFENLVELKH